MIPLVAADLTYTWSQALADLSQVAAIVTLTGFFLFAIVVDLVLPKSRRGGAVAIAAVTGFSFALAAAAYRWAFGQGGSAYHGFATGDDFALFFEILFATLGILTVALSHSYLRKRGLRWSPSSSVWSCCRSLFTSRAASYARTAARKSLPPNTCSSAASPAHSCCTGWR